MTKRIIILSFCMLFLVSITGLPLTIHFCKMMGSSFGNKKCGMCMMEGKHSKSLDVISLRRAMGNCCHTETLNNNVKDNFLSFNTEMNFSSLGVTMIYPVDCPFCSHISSIQFNDTSPPRLVSNNLYLFNSLLLI
jgi:hypothetical protein